MLPTCYIYPDSSRMRRQVSSHFCPGKVPLCTYCSVHVISFLPRHPAGIYPLECPFCRYVGALQVLGCSTFPVSDAPWHTYFLMNKWSLAWILFGQSNSNYTSVNHVFLYFLSCGGGPGWNATQIHGYKSKFPWPINMTSLYNAWFCQKSSVWLVN